MVADLLLTALGVLSILLAIWQFALSRRFPLHRRTPNPDPTEPITLLKPLRGCDSTTEHCLSSWMAQDYDAAVQILFGVASPEDPVCEVVARLLSRYPALNARLVICPERLGANPKVSTLIQLSRHAEHDLILISDADVHVPSDFLRHVAAPLQSDEVGLVHCLYRMTNPAGAAMRIEAVSVNCDFWSQVLQAGALGHVDFALGAAMATRCRTLSRLGGFRAIADYLADDYKLGNLVTGLGKRIELSNIVVDCCSPPMTWREVLARQLRWARTVRFCKPLAFLLSILGNSTLWPLVWLAAHPAGLASWLVVSWWLALRSALAHDQSRRLAGGAHAATPAWLAPVKDLIQAILWASAFLGNRISWQGMSYRVLSGGQMVQDEEARVESFTPAASGPSPNIS